MTFCYCPFIRYQHFITFYYLVYPCKGCDKGHPNMIFQTVLSVDNVLVYMLLVAFVKDNATMSSIAYFENRLSYFVQNEGSRPY